MALFSLRLRRVLTLTSSLTKQQRPFSTIPSLSAPPSLSSVTTPNPQNPNLDLTQHHRQIHLPFQSRLFRSSSITLSPPRSPSYNNNTEEIGPDTILFEGCDYNHWLITMDFPKDPKPTPEEMVETYVQTLAKVVGSVEEAKKCMYACSTTTYTGFQAVMTEEMSEKFRGLPGVVFILPDSYIDPVNKEYGGDKYINGTIIPRPPPVQYGRQGGRYGDRNREYNRNSPRGPPPNRGNFGYDNQGSGQGDRGSYGPQQSSPPQNYGPPRTGERRDFVPMNNAPGGRDGYQGETRDSTPPYQANYQQGRRDIPPGDGRGHSPPRQRDNRGENMNYAPPQGGPYGQGAGGPYGQGAGGPYWQGAGGPYGQGAGGPYGQGAGGPSGQGAGVPYGQGAGVPYGQGAGVPSGQGAGVPSGQGAGGPYGQGAGGPYGREMGSSYGQSQPGNGGDQIFSQVEQRNNMQGDQRNYPAMGSTGTDQGKY